MTFFKLAHFSDTHLGYEAYHELSATGWNQRGADIVRAFGNVTEDILASDVPLVIHSGDVAERTQIPVKYMLYMADRFAALASMTNQNYRRQLIVIAGNHEQPRSRKDPCFLELFRDIPGVHIITSKYERITFNSEVDQSDPVLDNLVVHCLPHEQLKEIDFDEVKPVPGKQNILTTHGVAGGSDLFVRSIGREYHIPKDLLARDWDYVALGHFHVQGPVSVSGANTTTSNIWYAGSTENISFRDLKDNNQKKGYLQVEIKPDGPVVTPRNITIRSMFRLPVVNAEGLSPEEISKELRQRVRESDLEGAIVSQVVTNVQRDTWSLVDTRGARDLAKRALHYEITTKYVHSETGEKSSNDLGDLNDVLKSAIGSLIPDDFQQDVDTLSRSLLGTALAAPPQEDNAS